jgi:alcohol dehydrogenase class IV
VHAPKIRLAETVEPRAARRVAEAIEVWRDGMDGRAAALAIADRLEQLYVSNGMPRRLRDLDIPREDFAKIAGETIKNFNANAGVRSQEAQIADAVRLLEAAY